MYRDKIGPHFFIDHIAPIIIVFLLFTVFSFLVLLLRTCRFGQKMQDNATLDLEKCPAIIKVQILYELKDGGD